MKLFITVGNTRFDSLFKAIDKIAENANNTNEFIGQIADGSYIPENFETFTFSDDITSYINQADAVICHAGAGSVFRLLENEKKLIVVFNTDRVDEHQRDIASYVEAEKLALTCWDVSKLNDLIKQLTDFTPTKYIKDDFHQVNNILNFVLEQ